MAARVREHVLWLPCWENPLKGWAINFIRKNQWRCERIHEFEDLLQDAYMTFLHIVDRYPRVIEPQHFMSLYKTALQNKMWDKARVKQHKGHAIVDLDIDAAEYGAYRIGDLTNNGYLSALMSEAPEEVRFALAMFASNPTANIWEEKPRRPYQQKPQPRENLNKRLSKAFGYKRVRFDFVGAVKALLTQEG